ncbi:MAG: hypothetical protein D6733_00615 [Methanobacteriota archaeon]|nr:MAG: hypothetical protein D6733_00615 [Euryarchaeota archaeon]
MEVKKNLLGLLLLPFCMGFLLAFMDVIYRLHVTEWSEAAFIAGAAAYPAVHHLLMKPRFLSTFAHEMTHVLWGLFFRAKIRDVRIKRHGGFVNLSKTNPAIRLAPYFFPFYTVFVLLSAFVVKPDYLLIVYFLVGFTLSMHITSTFESLKVRQPDIYKTGVLFALPTIFIMNLLVIIIVLSLIAPGKVSVTAFIEKGFLRTLYLLRSI